jgi:adenosylcobinamide kinase/adenosylcobinamide-phosphate guanylyltransferase
MLTLLLGGARSGKSALAVELGRRHEGPVTYLATSPRIDGDDDLDRRIARHRSERPPTWTTIEEELALADALERCDAGSLVIVDCCTTWVGNLVHHGSDEHAVHVDVDAVLASIRRRSAPVVVISNEVGMGVIPSTPLGRGYRDLLGRVNQRLAAAADRSVLLVAGRAIDLRDPWELLR